MLPIVLILQIVEAQIRIYVEHISLDYAYKQNMRYPTGHRLMNPQLISLMPRGHPDVDALFRNPAANPLPPGHPRLDSVFAAPASPAGQNPATPTNAETSNGKITISQTHVDLDQSYAKGLGYTPGHPKMQARFAALLPAGHPDIDVLMTTLPLKPLPPGHPALNSYVTRSAQSNPGKTAQADTTTSKAPGVGPLSIPYWHPSIDLYYSKGIKTPSEHLLVQDYLVALMPAGHPNIDTLMADPLKYPLPQGHPNIDSYLVRRARFRAGDFLIFYLLAIFTLTLIVRLAYKATKWVSANSDIKDEKSLFKLSSRDARRTKKIGQTGGVMDVYESEYITRDSFLPRGSTIGRNKMLNDSRKKNLKHKSIDLYKYKDVMPTLPRGASKGKITSEALNEKQATSLRSWLSAISKWRIPRTEWSMGTGIFLVSFLFLNILAIASVNIFVTKSFDFSALTDVDSLKLQFGSLAAVNTMILIIPATRNSVLTWCLGMPFDHVVVYHRWIGRWAIFCAGIHFILFFNNFLSRSTEYVYWTGAAAFASGIVIFVTAISWVRRNHFNIFYYAHFLFIAFFAFGFLHVRETRLYLAIGTLFYVLDRFLRALYTLIPRKTLVFQNKGKDVCHVRFPKNPITTFLGQHKVGQYYFINFPSLSMTEWHPFSVSSGPDEKDIELHIRALGDHTTEIVEYSKKCRKSKEQTWIRFDGPYGCQDFNYRRYPVLLLVGGGIGITPILGMLKDIYKVGNYSKSDSRNIKPHCMQGVYVTWVMSYSADIASFLDDLDECSARSKLSQFPPLVVRLYITRDKDLPAPLIAGRPDFTSILKTITDQHPDKSVLTFACGPGKMITELWDECRSQSSERRRIDFQHEVFEF